MRRVSVQLLPSDRDRVAAIAESRCCPLSRMLRGVIAAWLAADAPAYEPSVPAEALSRSTSRSHMVQIQIRLPDNLHDELAALGAQRHTPLAALGRDAIFIWLADNAPPPHASEVVRTLYPPANRASMDTAAASVAPHLQAEGQRQRAARAKFDENMTRRADMCAAIAERREHVRELETAACEARDQWLSAVEIAKSAGISYTESAQLSGITRSAITQALRHWRDQERSRPRPVAWGSAALTSQAVERQPTS